MNKIAIGCDHAAIEVKNKISKGELLFKIGERINYKKRWRNK